MRNFFVGHEEEVDRLLLQFPEEIEEYYKTYFLTPEESGQFHESPEGVQHDYKFFECLDNKFKTTSGGVSILEIAVGRDIGMMLGAILLSRINKKPLYYEMTDFEPELEKFFASMKMDPDWYAQITLSVYAVDIAKIIEKREMLGLDPAHQFDFILARRPVAESPMRMGILNPHVKTYANSAAPDHTLLDSYNAFRLFFVDHINQINHDAVCVITDNQSEKTCMKSMLALNHENFQGERNLIFCQSAPFVLEEKKEIILALSDFLDKHPVRQLAAVEIRLLSTEALQQHQFAKVCMALSNSICDLDSLEKIRDVLKEKTLAPDVEKSAPPSFRDCLAHCLLVVESALAKQARNRP